MISYFPKYFTNRAIALYVVLLVLIPVIFGHAMTWYWWVFGLVEVLGFFFFSNILPKQWSNSVGKFFIRNVFLTALFVRIAFVLFSYFFYINTNGTFFEFGAADSFTYHVFGEKGADMIANGQFDFWNQFNAMGLFTRGIDASDLGYPIYLSFLYFLTGKSIIFVRIVKALLSSITVVLAYRIAQRNFDEGTARLTAVFCTLMPNLIFYCGAHVKETEMLFLTVLFIDRADLLIRGKRIKWTQIFECTIICVMTYFFRAVLSIVLGLSLLTGLLLSSSSVAPKIKRLSIAGLIVLLMGTVFWNTISESLNLADYSNLQAQQEQNMQWRSERNNGNQFAKYAGAAVFAPLIFTIPFPTMVDIPYQETQQMIHGGNFVKNITSFFTILALLILLKTGDWRERVLPLAFMCGYLVVLVFSNFAQSERFHIPILPFSLMLAAYGISLFKKKHMQWFSLWLAFIFVANIGWAWFKLRGRGM